MVSQDFATVKILLFAVQSLSAVTSNVFPSLSSGASSATFARPSTLGIECYLEHFNYHEALKYTDALNLATVLLQPLVVILGSFVAISLRAAWRQTLFSCQQGRHDNARRDRFMMEEQRNSFVPSCSCLKNFT